MRSYNVLFDAGRYLPVLDTGATGRIDIRSFVTVRKTGHYEGHRRFVDACFAHRGRTSRRTGNRRTARDFALRGRRPHLAGSGHRG